MRTRANADDASLTVAIRVVPGSSQPGVGGHRGDELVVRVSERAVDGKATEAALVTLAAALGIRRRDVRLRGGATSRSKLVVIEHPTPGLASQIANLADADSASD